MKLIIDIHEEVYKKIVADKYAIYDKMFYSIKNGTPLDDIFDDIKAELWMEGMNMTGEYQGAWVRFRDIEKVIDKHIGKEKE